MLFQDIGVCLLGNPQKALQLSLILLSYTSSKDKGIPYFDRQHEGAGWLPLRHNTHIFYDERFVYFDNQSVTRQISRLITIPLILPSNLINTCLAVLPSSQSPYLEKEGHSLYTWCCGTRYSALFEYGTSSACIYQTASIITPVNCRVCWIIVARSMYL